MSADGRGGAEEPVLRFGAYARVTARRAPDAYFASPSYAPVVFTWGDIAYVMDTSGRAYGANLDTAAWAFAPDGPRAGTPTAPVVSALGDRSGVTERTA